MEFIKQPQQSQLAALLAQMEARRSDPIAQGILAAGQGIGRGLEARGERRAVSAEAERQRLAQTGARRETGILELLGKGGQFVSPDGTPMTIQSLLPSLGIPAGATYAPKTEKNVTQINEDFLAAHPEVAKDGWNVGQAMPNNLYLKYASKKQEEKAPPGYRFVAGGNLEAIQGGPASKKEEALTGKEASVQKGALEQSGLMIDKVNQALSKVSGWSTGWGAATVGRLPASAARDLQGDIDTIKANLGFTQLAEMRRSSPTGGALGQISDKEMTLLTSARASLDTAQSRPQIIQHLNEIKTHYTNWAEAVRGAQKSGGNKPKPEDKTTKSIDSLIDKHLGVQ